MSKWRRHAELLAPIFAEQGWWWGWDDSHIPDADEIEKFIEELEDSLTRHWWDNVSSGRLELRRDKDDTSGEYFDPQLSLHIDLE